MVTVEEVVALVTITAVVVLAWERLWRKVKSLGGIVSEVRTTVGHLVMAAVGQNQALSTVFLASAYGQGNPYNPIRRRELAEKFLKDTASRDELAELLPMVEEDIAEALRQGKRQEFEVLNMFAVAISGRLHFMSKRG